MCGLRPPDHPGVKPRPPAPASLHLLDALRSVLLCICPVAPCGPAGARWYGDASLPEPGACPRPASGQARRAASTETSCTAGPGSEPACAQPPLDPHHPTPRPGRRPGPCRRVTASSPLTEGPRGWETFASHRPDWPQEPEQHPAHTGRSSPRKTRARDTKPRGGRRKTPTLPEMGNADASTERSEMDHRCGKTAASTQRAKVPGTKPLTEAQQRDKQSTERGRWPRRGDPQKCRPTTPMTSGSRTFRGSAHPLLPGAPRARQFVLLTPHREGHLPCAPRICEMSQGRRPSAPSEWPPGVAGCPPRRPHARPSATRRSPPPATAPEP